VREYELTFIIQPEISDEGITATCEKLEGILESQGAHKLFYDDMGKRRLGYPIRRFQKGHYLTLFFMDEGKAVTELERSLKFDDSILRYLTVLGNERVADVEARKSEGADLERQRVERAAERAAREAEDAARAVEEAAAAGRQAEAASAAAAEAAAQEPASEPSHAAASEPAAEVPPEPAQKAASEPAAEAAESDKAQASDGEGAEAAASDTDESDAEASVAKEG
jgi:small subunit ribosomal protein S6